MSALSHAQRFVRPINTIDALIASNPNDPHTNVFIPQGPGGPGIFYQWRKNDTTATNDNQSVLGTDWPGAVGRWLKIPIQQGSVGGNTGISNPGTNGFAVVNTLADLRNIPGNLGIGMVYIRGHSQAYDWGQGFFSRVDDCSVPDDDGLTSAHGNDELTCWTRENRFPWSGTPVQYAGGTVTRTLINTVSQYLSTQGGGTVFITDGQWAIDTTNGPIILRNSVSIAGSASAVLVGDGYGTMFAGTNIHNAQILEVGISNVVTGVEIRGGTNILIGGNSFFKFGDGVRQYGGDDVRIEVNRFAEGTNGIHFSLDGAVKVTQGALIGNTFSGIVNSNILEDVGSIDGYQLFDNGPDFRLTQLLSVLWAGTNGFLTIGTGDPEGALARDPGSLFLRRDTGDVYRKATGTGNTGWVVLSSASVAGSDTQVQFNDGGVFGAGSALTWDKTLNVLTNTGVYRGSGSASGSSPTYGFIGSTGTGMYRSSAGINFSFGTLTWDTLNSSGLTLASASTSGLHWGLSSSDSSASPGSYAGSLLLDSFNSYAFRNLTTNQALKVYSSWTSASDYARIGINTSSTLATITPENDGVTAAITIRIVYDVANNVIDAVGAGSPEGVLTAGIGSTYRRTDGGTNTSFYIKESGTGNTGWVAK